MAGAARAEDVEGFVGGERVVDVAEVDGGDDLLGLHVGEQLPEGFVFGLGVEVPDGVDEGGGARWMTPFSGPSQRNWVSPVSWRVKARKSPVMELRVRSDDVAGEVLERLDARVGAAAEGEGEAVAFERGVGLEDAVGGGVVGVFVDGVGADLLARGGKAEIDDADAGDQDFVQVTGFPFWIGESGCGVQAAVQPPSMGRMAPLMNSASREQR